MLKINTAAGRAAKLKGCAVFPDDFERLKEGDFIIWRDGDDWEIETRLEDLDIISAKTKEALQARGCL